MNLRKAGIVALLSLSLTLTPLTAMAKVPTQAPTAAPKASPTAVPKENTNTAAPTAAPKATPSANPSQGPTAEPSANPNEKDNEKDNEKGKKPHSFYPIDLTEEEKTAINDARLKLQEIKSRKQSEMAPLMDELKQALANADKAAVIAADEKIQSTMAKYAEEIKPLKKTILSIIEPKMKAQGIENKEKKRAPSKQKVHGIHSYIEELKGTKDQAKISEICTNMLKAIEEHEKEHSQHRNRD